MEKEYLLKTNNGEFIKNIIACPYVADMVNEIGLTYHNDFALTLTYKEAIHFASLLCLSFKDMNFVEIVEKESV
jgi:hypothetical protein